jgi:hypothetical protein
LPNYEQHPLEKRAQERILELWGLKREQLINFEAFMRQKFVDNTDFPKFEIFSREDMERAFKEGWDTGASFAKYQTKPK